MLYFDENNNIIKLSSLRDELESDFIWVLDLEMMDYVIAEVRVLEELTSPSVTLSVGDFKFTVPTYWSIIVADKSTREMDVIDVGSLSVMNGTSVKAVVYGHNSNRVELVDIQIIDYSPNDIDVTVNTERKHVICHPIDGDRWIHITPSDIYNRYIKGHTTGSLQ